MTFDLISVLQMQIQTWHLPLWLCTHAKYYVKSGLTNVLKNANKTKNMHLFSIRIANYWYDISLDINNRKFHAYLLSIVIKPFLIEWQSNLEDSNDDGGPFKQKFRFSSIKHMYNVQNCHKLCT